MTLTDEERHKFSAYCQEEARSYAGLADSASKLPGGDALAMPMRRIAAAYAQVARHIESAEKQALSFGDGVPSSK